MEEDEGQDEESQSKKSATYCTKTICPFSLFLFNRKILKGIDIVAEHFEFAINKLNINY